MPDLTFAALLTAAGAGIAATLITSFVSLIKTVFAKTPIGTWDGMIMAFVLSALLYVADWLQLVTPSPDTLLALVIAWLVCAMSAVGIHKAVVNPLVDAVKSNGGN